MLSPIPMAIVPTQEVRQEVLQSSDFRLFLRQDLVQRCRKNPKYSLRAYARYFEIEPSALSRILRGERALTPRMFNRLADRCNLSPDLRRGYEKRLLPQAVTNNGLTEEIRFQELTEDRFRMISDWHHWALLELIRTKEFSPHKRSVASRLGISVAEVADAFERLERLGLIKKIGNTYKVLNSEITTVGIPGSGVALRRLQRQYLEKAIYALENVPFDLRDQSTVTLACDPKDLPLLKDRLKSLRREMAILMDRSRHKKSVYALTLSLFPLTQEPLEKPKGESP